MHWRLLFDTTRRCENNNRGSLYYLQGCHPDPLRVHFETVLAIRLALNKLILWFPQIISMSDIALEEAQ